MVSIGLTMDKTVGTGESKAVSSPSSVRPLSHVKDELAALISGVAVTTGSA